MNSKERVLTALRGGQPDRVPIVETPDSASLLNLAAALGIPAPGPKDTFPVHRMACRLVLELGLDAMLMPDPLDVMEHDGGIIRDRFGSEYRESVHGEPYLVRGPVGKLEDTVGLDMRPAVSSADFAPVALTRDALGPERPVVMWLTAPFKLSWRLRGGMQELLTDFAKRPKLVHALARVTTDLLVSMVDGAADAGVDVIILAGDIAGEEGPLFSPRHFREYVRPYYEEIVARSHARDMPVIYHGDGNMWPFMEEIIDIGFDGFNPIQPQCMDIAEVKRSVGDRLCLVGNIDCRDLLCTGTEEEVDRAVKETIAIAAPGGGYMLHSSNSLHHDVRPENYIAMVRAGQKYGIYPD